MVRKRGTIDFFKKTKVKKGIVIKFINLYNSYVVSKNYEYTIIRYNIEFDDNTSVENVNNDFAMKVPTISEKIMKEDSIYKWLLEIRNRILLSAINFKKELSNHKMVAADFEFLNELDKEIKENEIQNNIDDMEREMAADNFGDFVNVMQDDSLKKVWTLDKNDSSSNFAEYIQKIRIQSNK